MHIARCTPLRSPPRMPGLAGLLAILALGAAGCSNFYEVDRGRFYRSAQLGPTQLAYFIDRYGIRTVINLRGEEHGKDWYDEELAVCERLGVAHYDISMSSRRIPHKEDLRKLLDIFRDAHRPILVHCWGGSDRTGLASALWAVEYMGRTKRRARKMLRPRFGHFESLAPSKRYFLRIYQGQDWAYHIYDPCEQPYRYYDRRRNCPCEQEVSSAAGAASPAPDPPSPWAPLIRGAPRDDGLDPSPTLPPDPTVLPHPPPAGTACTPPTAG